MVKNHSRLVTAGDPNPYLATSWHNSKRTLAGVCLSGTVPLPLSRGYASIVLVPGSQSSHMGTYFLFCLIIPTRDSHLLFLTPDSDKIRSSCQQCSMGCVPFGFGKGMMTLALSLVFIKLLVSIFSRGCSNSSNGKGMCTTVVALGISNSLAFPGLT